jgi:hypothetical protein
VGTVVGKGLGGAADARECKLRVGTVVGKGLGEAAEEATKPLLGCVFRGGTTVLTQPSLDGYPTLVTFSRQGPTSSGSFSATSTAARVVGRWARETWRGARR